MSRLHDALRRSQGGPESAAGDSEPGRPGLEVFSGRSPRVVAPWSFEPPKPAPAEPRPPARPAVVRKPPETVSKAPSPRPRPAKQLRGPGRLVLLLLAAAAGVALLSRGAGGLAAPAGPQRLTGVVVANRVMVSAKSAGRVEWLAVDEGASVSRSDVVAVLDREEVEAERERLRALVQQLSARLSQAREVVDMERERGKGAVASAEAQLRVVRGRRDEATAGFEQLLRDSERMYRLAHDGLVPRQEVERVETDLRAAAARLRSLVEQVLKAEAEIDLAKANERQASVVEGDVEQTEAQLAQARAQLAQALARVSETEVLAPLSGMVSVLVAREGEVVKAGDPIAILVDPDDVWVRAELEESDVGRVAIGQTLDVELASGEQLSGPITFIEPEAGFATQRDVSRVKRDIRTFGLKVTLQNPHRRVRHGMTAYVLLPAAPDASGAGD